MVLSEKTVSDFFRERVAATPDAMAMFFDGSFFTWQRVDQITDALAVRLYHDGVREGQHVGILGNNSGCWYFYYIALQKLGAITFLYSTCLKERELHDSITHVGLKYLFYSEGYKEHSYEAMIKSLESDELEVQFFYMDKSIGAFNEAIDETLLEKICCWSKNQDACQRVSSVLFTSGTTQRSKAVMLSHHSLVNNSISISESMHWEKDDRFCLVVPLFHCFGLTANVLAAIACGGCLFILKRYRSKDVCSMVEEHALTVLNGVPTMFFALYNNKKARNEHCIDSIKSGIIAGSYVHPQDYMKLIDMFSEGVHIQPSYGQTEAAPCITIAGYGDDLITKSNSVGKPIAGVEVKIADIKTGDELDGCQSGEILTRGYNLMKGYVNDDNATKDAFTKDGWLKTGDIGSIDQYGFLSVTGRLKNIIIRGGENISPHDVELSIKEVVKDRAIKVIGIPWPVIQEEIVACIEGVEDPDLLKRIMNHLEKNLSEYMIPRYFLFVNSFPVTRTEKVDEGALKEMANARLRGCQG